MRRQQLQMGVIPMLRSLILNKVLDAPPRDVFIGPRRPQVPALKARFSRFNSSNEDGAAGGRM